MTITIPEWFLWFIVAWASVSAVLGLNLKLYTEILKDRNMASRTAQTATGALK